MNSVKNGLRALDKPRTLYILLIVQTIGPFVYFLYELTFARDPIAVGSQFYYLIIAIFSLPFYILAVINSNRNPSMAPRLAFIGLAPFWLDHASAFFGWLDRGVTLSTFLRPDLLYYVTIPSLALVVPTIYVIWLVRTNSNIGPLKWFRTSASGRLTRWFLAGALITVSITIIRNTLYESQSGTIVHEARWEQVRYSSPAEDCPAGFVDILDLEILEVPGYEIRICTTGAVEYLEASGTTLVPVTFRVQYAVFDYDYYEITQIGDWSGTAIRRPGSMTCIHFENVFSRGTQCGGAKVIRTTRELFAYDRAD